MKSIISIALNIGATSAMAFTLVGTNPKLRGFDTDELNVHINKTNCPANIEELVNNAFEVWNQVPTSRLKIRLVGTTSVTAATIVGLNYNFGETAIIVCSNNFDTHTGQAGAKDSAAGVGFAGTPTNPNRITKAFMMLNVDPAGSQNLTNFPDSSIQAVISHELGHMIGIGHSDNSAALMYYANSRTQLSLHQDDIDAITFLYPRNEFGQDGFFGCGIAESLLAAGGGSGGSKNNWPPTGVAAAILLPFMLLLWLRIESSRRRSRRA